MVMQRNPSLINTVTHWTIKTMHIPWYIAALGAALTWGIYYPLVEMALKRHLYNISKAAKELGLTRASLYRRMEKHGI